MQDGRLFGLTPYYGPGETNAGLMDAFGVTDNSAYRQVISKRGEDIGKMLYQSNLDALSEIDQGCLGRATAKGVPAEFQQASLQNPPRGPVPSNA